MYFYDHLILFFRGSSALLQQQCKYMKFSWYTKEKGACFILTMISQVSSLQWDKPLPSCNTITLKNFHNHPSNTEDDHLCPRSLWHLQTICLRWTQGVLKLLQKPKHIGWQSSWPCVLVRKQWQQKNKTSMNFFPYIVCVTKASEV